MVLLQHPLFVVCPLEREQGQAEVFDGLEAPHPQEIFLQRADEALRHAVTFGRSHKARGTLNPEERDLLLEIGGQVVRPVVVTQPQPAGGAVADPAEAFADTLADGLQGLEAVAALGRRQTDALGRAVIDGHEHAGRPKLWLSWGVKPSVLIGHSVGEYVCATLAGTFTLEDALGLLATRARLMQALPAGSMLAVRLGASDVEPLMPADASIAAINSPQLCTVSGPTKELETVIGDGQHLLLEVGPGQALSQFARQHPVKPADLTVLPTLNPSGEPGRDLSAMLITLGRLWIGGVEPDWGGFYAEEQRRRVPLPTYPFERKRFWVQPASTSEPVRQLEPAQTAASYLAGVETIPAGPPRSPQTSVETIEGPGNRKDRLTAKLKALFEELSGTDASQLKPATSFFDLGLDSLFMTLASQTIQGQFGVKVTIRQLMGNLSTLEALVLYLDAELPPDELAEPDPDPAQIQAPMAVTGAVAAASLEAEPALRDMPSPDGRTLTERVIQQQMAIMTQQLELLRRGPEVSGARPAIPRVARGAAPVVMAVKHKKEDNLRFGPFKSVDKGPSGGLTPSQQRTLDALVERYNRRTAKSKALAQQHRAHFCDPRAAGNFRQLWKEMVYPIVCARSKGARIWDIDGNEYIDVTMGFGTNYLGHSPECVVRAVDEQLRCGMEIGPQSPLAGGSCADDMRVHRYGARDVLQHRLGGGNGGTSGGKNGHGP